MPKFSDDRVTLFKRTADIVLRHAIDPWAAVGITPTPRLLSPFKPGGVQVRDDVNAAEVQAPDHNRASRRAAGLRGNGARSSAPGHGRRWRQLQHLIKGPRIQDVAAAARNAEGTES